MNRKTQDRIIKTVSDVVGKPVDIFIVDDHPLVRQALAQLIRQEEGLSICGEGGDIDGSLKAIAKAQPDVVILDLSLREGNGVRLIEELRLRHPRIRMLVLSMLDEDIYAERCLRAGAKGYVMKSVATQEVLLALRKVLAGYIAVHDRIASKLLSEMTIKKRRSAQGTSVLSNRELEIFELIGKGLSHKQIAEKVHRSIKTIHTHVQRIKAKLQLRGYRELVLHASKKMNE
jgi:DNA-binding NarL/FixJ family response regulator